MINRVGCVLGAAVIAAGLAEPAAADGIGLAQVVKVTLAASPELKLAATQVEITDGALLASGAIFDLTLTATATASRTNPLDGTGQPAIEKDLIVTAGVQRLLRNGVLLTSDVSLTRSLLSHSLGANADLADVRLAATIPLWRDRGGVSSAAAEQAAARDQESARWELRHTAAQQVLAAVAAYWDYQAAHARLAVLRSSETRADRTVEETRNLVAADERTPADLIQLQGNAASKRVTRISAEQDLINARTALGLAMGLPADAIAALPPPATEFPKPGDAAPLDASRLIGDAYRGRADLAAAEQDTHAASIRLEAARSDLRPRLDLILKTGYRSTEADDGLDRFLYTVNQHQPRLDGLVELRLELPFVNSAARGLVAQTTAIQAQRDITRDDLRRKIAAGVATGMEAVAHAAAAMREAEEAVRLFEAGVQAVQRKFQLGASTLFDLIQAQDQLTNALLAQVQSQHDHAVAIAALRFQAGRLVEGDTFQVTAADLVTPP
ncbi:MAG TPA: TolC family protein [Kofleriaceae bacterium]|nr:TolC family protein [Kofleriaceae bacterium]